MRKILITDDEESLCNALSEYLRLEGYATLTANSAEEARKLLSGDVDLIMLDIMMPGTSGVEFARQLRDNPETADIPIIFLTAKDSDDEMVAGLRLGADDYITKPYNIHNVLARIEAVLRRSSRKNPESAERGVVCDRALMRCVADGKELSLPRKEFELLAFLLEHPDRLFPREVLLDHVWPENVVVSDRTVDVHIARLRSKLGELGRHIVSRTGYGYGWKD